jgi:hypothetical protein
VDWRRWARKLGWGRNDMRRGSDHVEWWLTAWVLLAFVVAVPLVAGEAAQAMYRTDVRQAQQERQKLVQVEAVLLDDAATPYSGGTSVPADVPVARARWSGPDGLTHEGTLQVDTGDEAGARLMIWTDQQGTPTGPPLVPDPQTDAAVVGTAAGLGVAAVLGLLTCVAHGLLNRHRMRSWNDEWLEVGPHWTRHG